jgi:hypothetical protein
MPMPITVDRFVRVIEGFVAAGCPECGATGIDVLLVRPPIEPMSAADAPREG